MARTLRPGLHLHRPDACLAAFVEHYWLGLDNRESHYDILPDGCVDLVLHVSGSRSSLWAYGSATRLKREPIGAGHYLGIRFRPGKARFFLDTPAAELIDRRAPLAREIDLERCIDALDTSDVFAHLDDSLIAGLARREPRLGAVDAAIRGIEASRGEARIDAIANELGKSRRQLERDFLAAVGLGPKHFARICRFRNAAARIEKRPADSLAAIALDTGYADQAHMTRDFRELGGAPPSRWAGGVAFFQDA